MSIKEIVVISGKGGTGKTSLTASLVPYFESAVLADCDVDAPDLDILLQPLIRKNELFSGTQKAVKKKPECSGCAACLDACRFHAITPDFQVKPAQCEGCAVCTLVCPENLFEMKEAFVGRIFRSDTAYGPFIHARLFPGEETSGRLVSEVRKRAKALAESEGKDFVLIDGSPGIGCNVISSLTGADLAIVVTEPTGSGLHDLKRVFTLLKKFSIPALVVINRCDISEEISAAIEKEARSRDFPIALKIPFHKGMIQSITRLEIPSLGEKEFFQGLGWPAFVETIKRT
jgi:MinD superfamily P-loop ATPase